MTQLGMGVMINMLAGNSETYAAVKASIGETIKSVELKDDQIVIELENGSTLRLWDDGQSCCESRFITTDADLPSYKGDKIVDFETRELPSVEKDYDYHEQQTLLIKTDKGQIDFVTHVQHNGYYGGFYVKASLSAPTKQEEV